MNNAATPKVFNTDPDLELDEELIGFHAINPFVGHLSASRGFMSSSHISQSVTLEHGDEKLIQTGLEKQFGQNTFNKIAESDVRIVKVIQRYGGIDNEGSGSTVTLLVIVENMENGELDYIEVPYYFSLHQSFGFKYRWNKDLLESVSVGDTIQKGTVLAESPTVRRNDGYAFGINANALLASIPEVSEDGFVISESTASKMEYKVFERRSIEFGSNSFPLNMYGTVDDYKPFPEIGDIINDDGIVMALRKYKPGLSAALTSRNDVTEFDPDFDEAVYVKGPGGEIEGHDGRKIKSGKVVDIKIYHSPNKNKEVYSGTEGKIDSYIQKLKNYHREIISVCEEEERKYWRAFGKNGGKRKMSQKLHRLLLDSYAIVNPENKRISYSYKSDPIDIYRVEIDIEYTMHLVPGSKLSNLSGSKGIVVGIRPDDKMPVDSNGNRADIIFDPSSVPSRMNPGLLYEQYFNGMSRHARDLVVNSMGGVKNDMEQYSSKEIESGWKTVIDFLSFLDTEQYQYYISIKDRESKLKVLEEIIYDEFYIIYKVSSKKKPYQVISDIAGTKYEPPIGPSIIDVLNNKASIGNMMVAPMYFILLAKTADSYLSCASPATNNYGMPIGVSGSNRNRMPYRNNPVKIVSETESRLYTSYGTSEEAMIELKDRANSISTHKHIHANVLKHPTPTNMKNAVNRKEQPYGEDEALMLIKQLINASGINFVNVEEKDKRR